MSTQGPHLDKKAATQLLGGDPRANALRFAVRTILGGTALIALLITLGATLEIPALGFTAILLGLPWMLLLLVAFIMLLTSSANRRYFKLAIAAVQAGQINVSWLFYGRGLGMVVVDELARKLFVNGSIHHFSDVKQIEWVTSGRPAHLRVVLSSGENPVHTIQFGSVDNASMIGHRLHNALALAGDTPNSWTPHDHIEVAAAHR